MNQEVVGKRIALANAAAKAVLAEFRAEAERRPVLMWLGGNSTILRAAHEVRAIRRDAVTRAKRGI